MADDKNKEPKISEEALKSLDAFKSEIENINDAIIDMGGELGENLVKKLTQTVIEAKKIKNPLKEIESISKKINEITDETAVLRNQLSVSEKNYTKALQSGNQKEIERAIAKNNQLRAHIEINESLLLELASLKEVADIENAITEKKKKQLNISEKIKNTYNDWEKKYMSFAFIWKFLLDAAFKADKQTTELAKSLGIGKDQASKIREETVEYARAANDAFVTTSKLLEANTELQQQLGVSVKYTDKQAEDFARLTKLMGLSAEQAGKLARMSIINGKSIEATTKSIIKGSAAAQRENKISIDQREVLKDVSNLSAGILVKFNQNPEALGRAVVEARKLGLSLAEVDKIGDSLLDWTSSIGNELEAELLTNRQINVEKARYAALTGDQSTLMKEVAAQAGSLNEYENLNVIAQESLAKAFGMNREEMSKMLIEQEKINKLGDVSLMTLDQQLEALKAQGEPLDSVLYKQIQQQSAQEKFNQAVEKLQDILGNLIAGPFGQLLDIIANILNNTYALAAISAIYITRLGVIVGLKAQELRMSRKQAVTDATSTSAKVAGSAAQMGPVGWILAGAAALSIFGILSSMLSKGDDVVSAGYGKRMLLDKGSITAFNDNDTIVAGTNLGGKGGGGGGNNMEVVAAIRDMHSELKTVNSKPAVAYINGKDAFANNLGRSNSLGTSQVQNSYRLA